MINSVRLCPDSSIVVVVVGGGGSSSVKRVRTLPHFQ